MKAARAAWLAGGARALPARGRGAPAERRNFVACPIVRDTASVPCWLAEYDGELYFLTLQTDVSAPVTPPWLGHRVLVEGTVGARPAAHLRRHRARARRAVGAARARRARATRRAARRGPLQPDVRAAAAAGAERGPARVRRRRRTAAAGRAAARVRAALRLRRAHRVSPRRRAHGDLRRGRSAQRAHASRSRAIAAACCCRTARRSSEQPAIARRRAEQVADAAARRRAHGRRYESPAVDAGTTSCDAPPLRRLTPGGCAASRSSSAR